MKKFNTQQASRNSTSIFIMYQNVTFFFSMKEHPSPIHIILMKTSLGNLLNC